MQGTGYRGGEFLLRRRNKRLRKKTPQKKAGKKLDFQIQGISPAAGPFIGPAVEIRGKKYIYIFLFSLPLLKG